jgi:putative protease
LSENDESALMPQKPAAYPTSKLEILAPAGGAEALRAALAAGADAVYLGLKRLNARRGAANFDPAELGAVVKEVHAAGAKIYLTLNIDLVQRELGLAMRSLQLAEEVGVDAVLIRDPALLAAREAFPALPFHFSTQAAVTSSAGVQAAAALGISRVVLARELSKEEIAAAATIPGVEIEVFVQGALCFSCSGHCLLSSWVGGRSGNRGACASPCRVRWTNQHGRSGAWLSMHDLSLLGDLAELQRIGVASLKIEGRLKNADWVYEAVTLYRRALAKIASTEKPAMDLTQPAQLSAYSGRQLTNGYFSGKRENLTGDSGRLASTQATSSADKWDASDKASPSPQDDQAEINDDMPAAASAIHLSVTREERGGTLWTVQLGYQQRGFRIAPQRIAKPKRANSIAVILEQLATALANDDAVLAKTDIDEQLLAELLPRSVGNGIINDILVFLRLSRKEGDGVVRGVTLPTALQAALAGRQSAHPDNHKQLGDEVDCLRINADQCEAFFAANPELSTKLLLCCFPTSCAAVPALLTQINAIAQQLTAVSMPAVLYEAELAAWRALLPPLAAAGIAVEINSWDGWQLARESGCTLEAGPGMAVMNSLAARQLEQLGCRMVTASCELDREQLEELCAAITVPMSLTVFAQLPLMLTRAELPTGACPEDHASIRDKRHFALMPRREGSITALYSETALDWRSLRNPKITAARLIADLRAAPSLRWPQTAATAEARLANYERRLR